MESAILFLAGPLVVGIGIYAIRHPNGGYRPAGGLGSSLTPSARRVAGGMLVLGALAAMAVAVNRL